MRVSLVSAPVLVSLADPRRAHPPVRSTPLADLGPKLPGAIADRLACLMAQDPGLAEAVSARLPAARAESARDLAAYAPPAPEPMLDIRS
jgi:hypothetical protein